MPIVDFMGDKIRFPYDMMLEEIEDVLGGLAAAVTAVSEVGATIGSGAFAEPVAGLTALGTRDANAVEGMMSRMTRQPTTEVGKRAMARLGEDMRYLGEVTGLEHMSGYWRNRVVPALQEQAGPVAGSILAASGLAVLTALGEMNPGGRAASTSRRVMGNAEEGAIKLAYHGTADDIQGFDPLKRGASTKAQSAKDAFWFVDNPDVAAGYAKYAAEDVPVQRLIDQSYAAERAGKWDEAADLMAEAERLEASGELVGGGGQNIVPVNIDDEDLLEIDMDGAFYDPEDTPLGEYIKQAKSEGKRGLKIKNFVDNADYGVDTAATHYAVFDPEDIKPAYRTKGGRAESNPGIKAYHGSPHNFDEFKMSQIGTGEGAQAYGHGLYFAQNEDVARGYRNRLSGPQELNERGQAAFDKHIDDWAESQVSYFDEAAGLDRQLAIKESELAGIQGQSSGDDLLAMFYQGAKENPEVSRLTKEITGMQDARSAIDRKHGKVSGQSKDEIKSRYLQGWGDKEWNSFADTADKESFTRPGSMYEVNIDANPDELLDWDLPLSEQSEMVRGAMRNLKADQPLEVLPVADELELVANNDRVLYDQLEAVEGLIADYTKDPTNKGLRMKINKLFKEYSPDYLKELEGKYVNSGEDLLDRLKTTESRGAAQASEMMKGAGIKGIRYKDGFSRGTDKGTSNYVIFDDRLISISKKYGITIPAAAAMLASQTGEDTSGMYQ
jgi:hypothetical protein